VVFWNSSGRGDTIKHKLLDRDFLMIRHEDDQTLFGTECPTYIRDTVYSQKAFLLRDHRRCFIDEIKAFGA
jgi:hypothetical protein